MLVPNYFYAPNTIERKSTGLFRRLSPSFGFLNGPRKGTLRTELFQTFVILTLNEYFLRYVVTITVLLYSAPGPVILNWRIINALPTVS